MSQLSYMPAKQIIAYVDPALIANAFKNAIDPLQFEPDVSTGSVPDQTVAANFAEHGTVPAQRQAANALWRMDIDGPSITFAPSNGHAKPLQVDELYKAVEAHRHVDLIKKIATKSAIRVDMLEFLDQFKKSHPDFNFGSFAWTAEIQAARAAKAVVHRTVNWANNYLLKHEELPNDLVGYEKACRFLHFLITISLADPSRITKDVIAEWVPKGILEHVMKSLTTRTNDGYPLNAIKCEWVWHIMRGELFLGPLGNEAMEKYEALFGSPRLAQIPKTLGEWSDKNVFIASVARLTGSCFSMYTHMFDVATREDNVMSDAVRSLTLGVIRHRKNILECKDEAARKVFAEIGPDAAGSMGKLLRMLVLILNNDNAIWAQDQTIDRDDLKVFHRILTERESFQAFVKMAESLSHGRIPLEDILRTARDNLRAFVAIKGAALDGALPVSILQFFGRVVPARGSAKAAPRDLLSASPTASHASTAAPSAKDEELFFGIGKRLGRYLATTMSGFEKHEVGPYEFRVVKKSHSGMKLKDRDKIAPVSFTAIDDAIVYIKTTLAKKVVVYIKVVDGKIEVRSAT